MNEQANMDARSEAHAHAMGYAGVAEALDDLERRRNTPAIDLEQFRKAVRWARMHVLTGDFLEECNRLLALIDGQAGEQGKDA